jgi:MFS family permease
MIPKEIKILSLSFFILFFGYNGVQQFLTSYFSDLGSVRMGCTSLLIVYTFILISNFFSGYIVSRIGAKKCLIFGSLFYSLFIFSIISGNNILIYAASAFLGFGAAILWTAQGAFLVKNSASDSFGKSSGFFNTFFQLGTVVGIITMGLLLTKISFDKSLFIFAFLPLSAAVLFLWNKPVESSQKKISQNFNFFRRALKNQYFLRIGLIWFSFSLVLACVAGKFPLEIKEYLGLGSITFILPIFYVLSIIFSYYFGKKSDSKGRSTFIAMSLILVALGFLSFAIQNIFNLGFYVFILSFLLISLGYAIFSSIRIAVIGDVSSKDNPEYFAASLNQFGNMGYVVIFLLSAYFSNTFIYLVAFLTVVMSLFIGLPVLKLNMGSIKEKINI